jgi:hypothetical protein
MAGLPQITMQHVGGFVPPMKDKHPLQVAAFSNLTKKAFTGNGFFSGTVSINTVPKAGIIVSVWERSSGILVTTATTDSLGQYYIGNLPTGTVFDLTARDPDSVWESKVSSSRYPEFGYYPPIVLNVYGSTKFVVGDSATLTSKAYGGTGSYTYSVGAGTPTGTTFNTSSGTLSVPSIAAGNYTFTETATDGNGTLASKPITLIVSADVNARTIRSLMHFNGTNGSTVFTDQPFFYNRLWTQNAGSPALSNTQSKFGGTSLFLNGASSINSSDTIGGQFDIGAADATIECWWYPTATPSGGGLITFNWPNGSIPFTIGFGSGIGVSSGSFPYFGYYTGTTWIGTIGTAALANNQWYHIAAVQRAGMLYLYINGTQIGTAVAGGAMPSVQILNQYIQIGRRWDGVGYCTGYLDEVRVTVGIAQYTANFTPPTAPFS